MFTLDSSGILLTWNAGVQQILGYAENEWVGQHASIIFTADDNGRDICQSEMNLAEEKGFSADIRWHIRKDGSSIFGQGCMTALRDAAGDLMGYAKIFSDETENKKLQDSLTESNAALEQFAYVASHDLQEPLRTISSYSDLLVKRYRHHLDDEGQQVVNLIADGAKRMSALVQDLLIYARVQTERDRPASSSLDFRVGGKFARFEAGIADELRDFRRRFENRVRPELGKKTVLADGLNHAADAPARLINRDRHALAFQIKRSGQPRDASADDRDGFHEGESPKIKLFWNVDAHSPRRACCRNTSRCCG